MQRFIAIGLSLIALLGQGHLAVGDQPADKSDKKAANQADSEAAELTRLAGKYTAEFSVRTGQAPAEKDVLKLLTLEITKNEWRQDFRGDVAPYTIALDVAADPREMRLTHKKVPAVRDCLYELKNDTLTVTEQLGEGVGTAVTIWKRVRTPIN